MTTAKSSPRRSTYRHGDLQRVLLAAGIELARAAGPDAVVLREVTRRAGVVPNAAYRHFASRDDLLRAVRSAALAALALAIEAELARVRPGKRVAEVARAKLHAVGVGYLRFAQAEPGLFRTAFVVTDDTEVKERDAMTGNSGLNPFELLGAALDEFVVAGLLAKAKRPGAEYLAWSAVHGLATLVIDGPLRRLDRRATVRIGDRLLEMVEKGLG
ncbi:MAG: TetR/AcrR family transcriptional regulator [Betaproteobacteria bacterium]